MNTLEDEINMFVKSIEDRYTLETYSYSFNKGVKIILKLKPQYMFITDTKEIKIPGGVVYIDKRTNLVVMQGNLKDMYYIIKQISTYNK